MLGFANLPHEVCLAKFCIRRSDASSADGWVVETTHDNGAVDVSVVYGSQADAQRAADGWAYLDEDWAEV
jgi:hypothetical protein